MIHADLHSKNHVPEDVLTSNCLGLLSLLPDSDLLGFFTTAQNAHNENLLMPDMATARAELKFWQFLRGGGIPDAILTITSPGALPFKVIVEVKHGAPQSGDQLAIYWRAAQRLFPDRCAVVYLTHHRVLPKAEIDESNRVAGSDAKIYWLGWFDLFLWARTRLAATGIRPTSEERILKTLHDYLAEKGYRTFSGWNVVTLASLAAPYDRCYTARSPNQADPMYQRRYQAGLRTTTFEPYARSYSTGPLASLISQSYTPQPAE